MARFIELDDDEPPQDLPGAKPLWHGAGAGAGAGAGETAPNRHGSSGATSNGTRREEAHELPVRENPNRNSMTEALGCYP